MQLHEKVVEIRKQKKLKITDVHKKLEQIFGDRAVSYRTLLRIEKGETDGRDASLYQICLALGITLKELKEMLSETSPSVDLIKRKERKEKYIYNEKVFAEIITGTDRKLFTFELFIRPKGRTKEIQDQSGNEKLVHVLKGHVTCVIAEKRYKLYHGDSISFDSSLPHYFENPSTHRTNCLIVQTHSNIQ